MQSICRLAEYFQPEFLDSSDMGARFKSRKCKIFMALAQAVVKIDSKLADDKAEAGNDDESHPDLFEV